MSSSLGLVSIENGITWIDEVMEGIEFSCICGMILLSSLVLWSHLGKCLVCLPKSIGLVSRLVIPFPTCSCT